MTAAEVAIPVAELVLAPLIKKAASVAWRKIKNPKDLDPHTKMLLWKPFLEGLLQNIELSAVGSDDKKNMIKIVSDVKDDLDYLLDEGANITERKEIMGSSSFRKFQYFFLHPRQLLSPYRFARKSNAVRKKVEEFKSRFHQSFFKESKQNQGFCMEEVVGPLITEVVIGRERDRDNIIPLLCDSGNGQESVSVVAIVGIGGQGKTTLAMYVCNHLRVRAGFDVLLWVSCTQYSSFTEIVDNILSYGNHHPQSLQATSAFEGKRCLIVLDNVWYQNSLIKDWMKLKRSLGVGGCLRAFRSTVLITTRSEAVARFMDTPKPYMLNDLGINDSLLLLQHFARVQGQDPRVEAMEKEIVELLYPKVPLVVKNIGCQLAQRHSIGQWQDFKDKLASTSTIQLDDRVLGTLKLSYDQLDENWKSCVAYCSLFKRRTFATDRMVHYWMALDFVKSEADGEDCIDKLAIHGFLEVYNCGFFKLHDVMYGLISRIGKSKHQKIDSETREITKGVRHVSLDKSKDPNWDDLLSELKGGEQLQSIVTEHSHAYNRRERGTPSIFFYLLQSTNLCASSLGQLEHVNKEGSIKLSAIEKIVSKFSHLRVLHLHNEGMEKVPTSIGELIHLRHLDLSGNPLRKLPNSITKLVKLLSLDLSYCENLEKLPKDMGNLAKLRHLWLDEECNLRYMPKGFGNLTELQTLNLFVVGEKRSSKVSKSKVGGAKLEELGRLNNLKGDLCIYVRIQSKDIVSEATEADLQNKTQLTHLGVKFEMRTEEDEKFLDGLQPSRGLETLDIRGYGGKSLPLWMTGSCLPKLNQLALSDIPELAVVPEEFRDFSSLTHLSIDECPKLKEIPDWIHSLSSLTQIQIANVPEMKALPDSIGSLTSLSSLELRECPGLESLPHQLSNLHTLDIDKCSKALFKKCQKPKGEYWLHLQHLPNLYITSSEGHTFESHASLDTILEKVRKFYKVRDQAAIKVSTPSVTESQKVVNYFKDQDKQGGKSKTPTPSHIESQTVAYNSKNQDKQGGSISTPISSPFETEKVLNELINLDTLPLELLMCYKCAQKMDGDEQITVRIDIGNSAQSNTIHLGKEEMIHFLAQKEIGVCHILPYMSATYAGYRVSNFFGFLCPSGISVMSEFQEGEMKVKESREKRSQYIVDVFKEKASKGKVFLAPYNAGFHWVLCVIDPYNNIVYYLDSLHNQENVGTSKGIVEDLRKIVEVAMSQFRSEMEITTELTKWITVKCPRQGNFIDCGYFVMRFMKEIVSHRCTRIPESYFDVQYFVDCLSSSYDQRLLDEVRIEWAQYILFQWRNVGANN